MENKEISNLCKQFANNIRELMLKELDEKISKYKTDMVKDIVAQEFAEAYNSILKCIKTIERKVKVVVE